MNYRLFAMESYPGGERPGTRFSSLAADFDQERIAMSRLIPREDSSDPRP
jgi:hypothetical protein